MRRLTQLRPVAAFVVTIFLVDPLAAQAGPQALERRGSTAASPAPAAAAKPQEPWDPLAGRVSIDLREATPADLFRSFEAVLYDTVHAHVPGIRRDAVRIVLDPLVRGPVTICLENVTLRTAITAVCESIGCAWKFRGASGPLAIEITVLPLQHVAAPGDDAPAAGSSPASLDGRVHAQFDKVEAGAFFAIVGRTNGYRVVVAPELAGKAVTLDVEAPLREVLDAACEQVTCSWSARDGMLTVRPR